MDQIRLAAWRATTSAATAAATNASGAATGPPVASTVNASSTVVSSSESVQQTVGPALHQPHEYEVEYHLHQGEVISLQLGDGRVQIIPGKTYFFFLIASNSLPYFF